MLHPGVSGTTSITAALTVTAYCRSTCASHAAEERLGDPESPTGSAKGSICSSSFQDTRSYFGDDEANSQYSSDTVKVPGLSGDPFLHHTQVSLQLPKVLGPLRVGAGSNSPAQQHRGG